MLGPVALTQSTQGASYDAHNLDVSTNAIISLGAIVAGITGLNCQIEESSTGTGSWTAIPNMVMTTVTQSTGAANTTVVLRGQRTYQYVRANFNTASGTTVSAQANVVLLSQAKFTSAGSAIGTGVSLYPSA